MIGTSLSHYQITAELGRDCMGIVSTAEDTKLDGTVIIKILRPGLMAVLRGERFLADIRVDAGGYAVD